ncbi:MAG: GNAT family N-acetyltransferase [Spirochaetales bacterium]|nr:GNAT family N-acetyltransferase [Spirochaetales bacterium]
MDEVTRIADVTIAPARVEDAPLITSFIKELAEYEKLSHKVEATESMIEEALFGSSPAAEAVIARCGDEPAGFALFFTTFSTFVGRPGLYLEDLFVRPRFRAHGIGRALLVYLARTARERNYGRVEWAVLDWNTRAISFYRSLGANAMDEWTVYRLDEEALTRLAAE